MNHLARDAVSQVVSARRILAVFNPAAGKQRRSRFERVVATLRGLGCEVTTTETEAPGHAEAIARDAAPGSYDVIAAAGGDGTINEIVNGLAGKSILLGLIPIGTANVVADEIGLGRSVEEVARVLAFGQPKPIRVGCANGRHFVMMAGVGFDANVVHTISLPLKRRLGPLAYVWQAFVQGFRDRFDRCSVVIDGISYHAVSAVACNGRRYGGPFVAAPNAALTDDGFHVILMKGQGWFNVMRYGIALVLGRISTLSDVELVVGRDVLITGTAGQPVQADGDIVASLPLRITVEPHPIQLIYP